GLRTLVVEREAIGGQSASSAQIRNYLGFPRGVSGAELAQRAYQQAWVLGTEFLLMREVASLAREDGRLRAEIAGGGAVSAGAVVLAPGIAYRRLAIPALERFAGAGVFYGASASEAPLMAGLRAAVVGGGNSAGQTALHLQRYAERVTLIVRGDALEEGMSQYLVDEIATTETID